MRIFLLHHVTWSINSICHYWGRRRFVVRDESRNVWWLAWLSFGESWHNNHHAFPSSAFHGLTRALVANMVTGVTDGYRKQLEIIGVGYRAVSKGPNAIELALGYSHPVLMQAPEGVTFEVPQPTRVDVIGIDKQKVGQVAANIRNARPPEPYKGKGVRYSDERVVIKETKKK